MTSITTTADSFYRSQVQAHLDPFLDQQRDLINLPSEQHLLLRSQLTTLLASNPTEPVHDFASQLLDKLPTIDPLQSPLPLAKKVERLCMQEMASPIAFSSEHLMKTYIDYGMTRICHKVVFPSYSTVPFIDRSKATVSIGQAREFSQENLSAECKKIARAVHRALFYDFPSASLPSLQELEQQSQECLVKTFSTAIAHEWPQLFRKTLDDYAFSLLRSSTQSICIPSVRQIQEELKNALSLRFPFYDFTPLLLQKNSVLLIASKQEELLEVFEHLQLPLQQEIAQIKKSIQCLKKHPSFPPFNPLHAPTQKMLCDLLDRRRSQSPNNLPTKVYEQYRDLCAIEAHWNLIEWLSPTQALAPHLALLEENPPSPTDLDQLLSPTANQKQFPLPESFPEELQAACDSYIEEQIRLPLSERRPAQFIIQDIFRQKIQPRWPRYNIILFSQYMETSPEPGKPARIVIVRNKIESARQATPFPPRAPSEPHPLTPGGRRPPALAIPRWEPQSPARTASAAPATEPQEFSEARESLRVFFQQFNQGTPQKKP